MQFELYVSHSWRFVLFHLYVTKMNPRRLESKTAIDIFCSCLFFCIVSVYSMMDRHLSDQTVGFFTTREHWSVDGQHHSQTLKTNLRHWKVYDIVRIIGPSIGKTMLCNYLCIFGYSVNWNLGNVTVDTFPTNRTLWSSESIYLGLHIWGLGSRGVTFFSKTDPSVVELPDKTTKRRKHCDESDPNSVSSFSESVYTFKGLVYRTIGITL